MSTHRGDSDGNNGILSYKCVVTNVTTLCDVTKRQGASYIKGQFDNSEQNESRIQCVTPSVVAPTDWVKLLFRICVSHVLISTITP